MDVYTLRRIEDLIENTEIEIESANIGEMTFNVILPYESSSITIEVEGTDDDSIVESFKENVNDRLNQMINHLNDCKLV